MEDPKLNPRSAARVFGPWVASRLPQPAARPLQIPSPARASLCLPPVNSASHHSRKPFVVARNEGIRVKDWVREWVRAWRRWRWSGWMRAWVSVCQSEGMASRDYYPSHKWVELTRVCEGRSGWAMAPQHAPHHSTPASFHLATPIHDHFHLSPFLPSLVYSPN